MFDTMFFGQHHHAFDAGDRLPVPPRYSEQLSRGAYITQGFDRNLLVLTAETFQSICERFTAMNMADPLARLLLRMILGTAAELEFDESGRMIVPQKLREFAGLDEDAILVGQGRYIELWTPALWQKQEIRLQDAEANADRFAALVITG